MKYMYKRIEVVPKIWQDFKAKCAIEDVTLKQQLNELLKEFISNGGK